MVPLGLRKGHCFLPAVVGVDLVIAFVDCLIAVLAFYQLLRIHSRSQQLGWTRQKVFHFLTGCSNFGYFVYFVLTLVATCNGWKFWSPYSFVLMASPEILFFTSFLLLLSFWIDLCHQANDEDEDEECSSCVTLLQSPLAKPGSSNVDGQARCLPVHYFRVRSRQRIVVLAACLILVVMISVAVGIGVGGTTSLELIPKIYVSLLAVVMLILGGALAYYGFLICSRLRRVRSESESSEMWKVGGLSVVSLLCFTTNSVIALLPDSPVLYLFQEQQTSNAYMIALIILYYFVGLSVPSAFLLWVMRELPQPISPSVREEPVTITFITDGSVSVQRPPQWTTALGSQNQVLRSNPKTWK